MTSSYFHQLGERIGSLIPGFTGYSTRSDFRNCEKRFRVATALLLRKSVQCIEFYQVQLLQSSRHIDALKMDELRKQVCLLADNLEFANYGESGLFALKELGQAELERIYSFDSEIAINVAAIVELSEVNRECISNVVNNLQYHCKSIEQILVDRSAYIKLYK